MIAGGPPEAVRRDPRVIAAYRGGSVTATADPAENSRLGPGSVAAGQVQPWVPTGWVAGAPACASAPTWPAVSA